MNIGYGRKVLTDNASISVSASKSNMNSNGTTYQNGLFVNVDEVHNNTKNMTLSGFNQIGGKVTGNIQNLTIESKQNTSTTTGSTKGGSIGFAPNGMPNSISANYSQTNGERKYVDDPTTFIIGDGSNLKVGKVENTAGAIGATGNGKLSIDEYIGHNLENKDETKTKGASLSLSPSSTPVSGVGINYANRDLESVTKNTVVGNVSIGKSSGDEINKDLASMTEVTKDEDTKTNIFIESQTIKYALNPSQFKEDLQIAIIEGKATGRTVVKTIDNMINGDKSQDIGDAEKRSLIEIKEAIVRVQTAPAMDIIAEKDLADKNIQARLGVVIEKFDPNDPTLSEKVRERIDELKAEGKEIVAFYDKVTKKIFINQNAKDEEVRASIAREYKIKEDLELGRGKANDKGQLRSTVAGEIAYDEIKDRLKKGDKNPISASSFDVAKMDKDSEVTSDKYSEELKADLKKAGAASRYGMLYEELEESGKSPEEILDFFEKYEEKIVVGSYHRFKTNDNLFYYRSSLYESLDRCEDNLFDALVLDYMDTERVERDEAGIKIKELIQKLRMDIEEMEAIMRTIDDRHILYRTRAVQRAQFLLLSDGSSKSKINNILRFYACQINSKEDVYDEDDSVAYDIFQIFGQNFFDCNSLSTPVKKRKPTAIEFMDIIEELDQELIDEKNRKMMEYIKNALTSENVNRFARDILSGNHAVQISSVFENDPDTLIKIIGLYTYSKTSEREYDIRLRDNVVESNGVRFKDFIVEERR